MKRLIPNSFKTNLYKDAKPRRKKKELKLTAKFVFEVFSDDEINAKDDIKSFRNWMRDEFPKWSDTILQHFLYQNKLFQSVEKPKYLLAVNVDKIIKDESSIKDEREYFDNELENLGEDAEKAIRKKEEEMFGTSIFNKQNNAPKEQIKKEDNIKIKSIK